MSLTTQQQRCLEAIARLTDGASPPTYRALMADMDVASSNNIHRLVHGLKNRGFIDMEPYRKQSMRLTDKGWQALNAETINLSKFSDADLRGLIVRATRELELRA